MKISTLIVSFSLLLGSLGALPPTSWASQNPAPVLALDQGAPTALRVRTGRSMVITTEERLRRVSVTDPGIASAAIITPTQVLVHGGQTGTVTLILWNQDDEPTAYDLVVELDVPAARETLQRTFPGEDVDLFQSGNSLVLTGNTSTQEIADRARILAGTMGGTVVDLLTTTENRQTVMLEVRFAEVDRNRIEEFGLTLLGTGATNTPGAITTGQFGAISSGSNSSGGGGNQVTGSQADFSLGSALNVLLFRPDLDIGVAIRAMEQDSSLEVLAEPTVLARTGTEASFLAGGEFPFPAVQSGSGSSSTSIQFKEFGVRLTFLPTVRPDGSINLRVSPEVSALDFANALTVSGFLVPALTTRRAEAEVDLQEGQTFAIAGLIDQRLTEAALKVPILGDIPILGRLFRSRQSNESRSELLVMITPRIVEGLSPDELPPLPNFPVPFSIPSDGQTEDPPVQNGRLEDEPDAVVEQQAAVQ